MRMRCVGGGRGGSYFNVIHLDLSIHRPIDPSIGPSIHPSVSQEISLAQRESMARVCNCLRAMCMASVPIHDRSLMAVLEVSTTFAAKDLLRPAIARQIVVAGAAATASVAGHHQHNLMTTTTMMVDE